MSKTLIVIDMQNDFIDGSLGTKEAQAIVSNVAKKIDNYIYIRGYDGGFPHAAATAKFDIDTGKFVEMWGFYGCPVTITEGMYE